MKKSTSTPTDGIFDNCSISDQCKTIVGYNDQERMQLIRQSYIDIINTVSDAIYVLDNSFTFIEINKGAEKMYQYSREELIGMNPDMVSAPGKNDMLDIFHKLEGVLQTGEAARFEFWARRKNGEVFPKEVIVNRGKFFTQDVLIATARDMTERKKNEIANNQKDLEFLDLFENAPIGYHEIDMDGRIVRMNQTELNMLGYTFEELKGHFVWELLADKDKLKASILEKIKKHQLSNTAFEREFLRKDGTCLSILETDKLITAENGEVKGIRSAIQDNTERKNAELEVLRLSTHYQAIIEKSPDGFVLLNGQGKFTYASPTSLKMFGFDFEDLVKFTPNELTHPDDLAFVLEHLNRMYTDSSYIPVIEYRFRHKDGSWIWIESTFSNLLQEPNIQSILINFRNINDRKLAEEELLKNKEFLNELLQKNSEFIESTNEDVNFEKLCEQMQQISGAKYASFNLYDANGLDFRTVALSGLKDIYSQAAQFLGFDLKNKVWKFDPKRDERIKPNKITRYNNLLELNGKVIPKAISLILMKTLNLGEVNIVNISKKEKRVGDFTLFFNGKSTLENPQIVELFAYQVALYVERKTAEKKQLETQEKFQAIFDSNATAIAIIEKDTTISIVNEMFCKLTGYSKVETFGMKWTDLVASEDIERSQKFNIKCFEDSSEVPESYDIKIIRRDAKIRDFQIFLSLIDNKQRIIASFTDITHQKEADRNLQKSENLFKTLYQTSPDVMTLTRLNDGIYVSVNQGFSNVLGYDLDEIIGYSAIEKNIWYDLSERKQMVDLLLTHGEAINEEFRFLTKDHKIIYALMSGKIIEIDGINHMLAIARPINDLKAAQNKIKESLDRLNQAEIASKSGNWEFYLDTKKMTVSEGANLLYGLDNEHYNYEDIKWIPLAEYRPMMDLALKNLIEKNEPYNIEFKIKTADTGEIKDIHSTAYFDSEKRIIFGVIHDITEQKVAERKLQANRDMLSKLLFTSTEFIDSNSNTIDYKKISDLIVEISGARYCSFNILNQNKPGFKTIALSGIDTLQKSIKSIFGFDLLAKEWEPDLNKEMKINHKICTKFDSLSELAGTVFPAKLVSLVTKMFDIDEVWVVQIKKNESVMGDFTLIFSKNETLRNVEIVELYANQVALFIERKYIENELQESEKKYKILFAENPQPMLVYDLETLNILEINETAVDYYGYSREELIHSTISELHPPEEIPEFLKAIEETRKGNNTDGVSMHQKKNGDKVYVNISATSAPIFGKNARHILIEDITERIQAEKKLIDSELFFRQSQQAAKIGSYNLNLATGMWSSSEVLDQIFGIDNQYVRSVQGWLELVAEEDREMMNDYFANYVLGQQQRFNKEYRISRKSDGKIHWVLGLGELIIENNVITAMVGTIQDISERKNAEIVLLEKMNELQRFHNLTVNRELNMIQLKKEINDLRLKSGLESKYKIVE